MTIIDDYLKQRNLFQGNKVVYNRKTSVTTCIIVVSKGRVALTALSPNNFQRSPYMHS